MIWKWLTEWRVKKATRWINKFEKKTDKELTRILDADTQMSKKVKELELDINYIKANQKDLTLAKSKIQNLKKALSGE